MVWAANGALEGSNTARSITVAVADKNPLVLSALSEVLERDSRFSLVLTATTAERFLEALARVPVVVGVIGWVLPKLGGQRVLEALRDRAEAPRLLVYSSSTDPDVPRKAMAAGAAGFCAKNESPARLLDALVAVAKGQMVFPYLDVRRLSQDPMQVLTDRERDLLASLARGLSNAELARDFGISINTVKFHLRNLFEKLAIKSRAQAIARFYETLQGSGTPPTTS